MRFVEPLEGRTLFSWPSAPFARAEFAATIYVNPFGNAVLSDQTISHPGQTNGYDVYFDDPGSFRFETRGTLATRVAFYPGDGQPTRISRRGLGALSGLPVNDQKQMMHIAVQALNPTATGSYDLIVHGVAQAVIRHMNHARTPNWFYEKTDISGSNDADAFSFVTPVAGSWTIWVVPDHQLDVTMQVYDSAGNPIGGSYSTPINNGGVGFTESWTGTLTANTTYYIRTDGFGDSTGHYQIFIRPTPTDPAQHARRHRHHRRR